MATANTGWFNAGSNPTVQVRCEVEATRPATNSGTINVWWTVRMKLASGYLGTGVINVTSQVWSPAGNHSNATNTIKAQADRWTNTSEHVCYGTQHSFSWGAAVTLTIKFSSSGAFSSSGIFSGKEVQVSIPAPYDTPPTAPSNVKIPATQHFNTGFKITWTKGTKGTRDIWGYDIQGRAYNGSVWSAWSSTFNAVGNVGEKSMDAPRTLNYGGYTVGSYLGTTKFQFRVRTSDGVSQTSAWVESNQMAMSKNGKICAKDTSGATHEVTRVRVKDTGGTVRTVTSVKVKDTGGTVHNIELYY